MRRRFTTHPPPSPPMKEELERVAVSRVSPEDEGIFTGKYPSLQKSNINKMENRYLHFKKLNFFVLNIFIEVTEREDRQ